VRSERRQVVPVTVEHERCPVSRLVSEVVRRASLTRGSPASALAPPGSVTPACSAPGVHVRGLGRSQERPCPAPPCPLRGAYTLRAQRHPLPRKPGARPGDPLIGYPLRVTLRAAWHRVSVAAPPSPGYGRGKGGPMEPVLPETLTTTTPSSISMSGSNRWPASSGPSREKRPGPSSHTPSTATSPLAARANAADPAGPTLAKVHRRQSPRPPVAGRRGRKPVATLSQLLRVQRAPCVLHQVLWETSVGREAVRGSSPRGGSKRMPLPHPRRRSVWGAAGEGGPADRRRHCLGNRPRQNHRWARGMGVDPFWVTTCG
jgi:hypothetical protein